MVLEEDPGHRSRHLIILSHLAVKEVDRGVCLVRLGQKGDQFLLKKDTDLPGDLSLLRDELPGSLYLQGGGHLLEGDLHHVHVIGLRLP